MGEHGTREQWAKRIARFERSGVDAGTFAAREGVTKKLLLWWRWRLRRDAEAGGAAKPASENHALVTSAAGLSFVRVALPQGPAVAAAPALEVMLTGGRSVRVPVGFDADTLGRVLEVIDGGIR